MREVVFSIYHHDCWCPKASEKFPHMKIELASNAVVHKMKENSGTFSAVWKFFGPSDETKCMLDFVKGIKGCLGAEPIYKSPDVTLAHITMNTDSLALDRIMENKCYITKPLVVEGGLEHWSVLTEYPTAKLLDDLSEVGELQVHKHGACEPKESKYSMTGKQEAALRLAIAKGYYSWPKKVKLEEMADASGVKRVTFQNHLRKAEAKALNRMMDDGMP